MIFLTFLVVIMTSSITTTPQSPQLCSEQMDSLVKMEKKFLKKSKSNDICTVCKDNVNVTWLGIERKWKDFHEFYDKACSNKTSLFVTSLNETVSAAIQFAILTLWMDVKGLQNKYTLLTNKFDNSIDGIESKFEQLEEWRNDTLTENSSLLHHKEPIFEVNNIKGRVDKINENTIHQDGRHEKSNKVTIHGETTNDPGREIRQSGSDGKSNKVSFHENHGKSSFA